MAELPINTSVILLIAIVVLIAVIAIFVLLFPKELDWQQALNSGCFKLQTIGCNKVSDLTEISVDYDADRDGEKGGAGDNLAALCADKYPGQECKAICKCPGA